MVRTLRFKGGEGLVGAAVAAGQPLLVNDVRSEPRYVEAVPGSQAELVVPLRRKGRVIGALNLLSETPGQFTEADEAMLRQFAAHVSVAIENARLFEKQREYASTLETLAEVGREFGAILQLDELLTRITNLTRRVIEYRTFGILLLNEESGELEMKVAVRYGDKVTLPRVQLGVGLVGYAALHKEAVVVPDVSTDPRYIKVVDDAKSELVIPLLLKDRCIGVFDLESPELDAFSKTHVEILTLLASQAAVAIENARLYETILANEERLEKEIRFAQRVQAALLPTELPKRMKGVDVAARFAPARELGGDLYDFLAPEPNTLAVAVGDVSGKGVPAALYCAFAGELIRSRTFRRRYRAGAVQSRGRAGIHQHDSPRAATRGVLLHALLLAFRSQAPRGDARELRVALPGAVHVKRRGPDLVAGRPARVVCGIDVRRGDVRTVGGGCVPLLLGRCLRGHGRIGAGVRGRARGTGRAGALPHHGPRSGQRDFRSGRGVPRRDAAKRRYDGRGRQNNGMNTDVRGSWFVVRRAERRTSNHERRTTNASLVSSLASRRDCPRECAAPPRARRTSPRPAPCP